MTNDALMIIIFFYLLLGLEAVAANDVKTGQAPVNPILVGVTPNYPPVIFKRTSRLQGWKQISPDGLWELGRPIEFVEISWERQIPALLEGRLISSCQAMTITQARQVRINFSQPYLTSGLMIAFRSENASQYTLCKHHGIHPVVGFVAGTDG